MIKIYNTLLKLREEYPRWGKERLVVLLLRRRGWRASTSMVRGILRSLKERGVLREPSGSGISARQRPSPKASRRGDRPRPYAVRKPKYYQARGPGELVQVDSLDVRPLAGWCSSTLRPGIWRRSTAELSPPLLSGS